MQLSVQLTIPPQPSLIDPHCAEGGHWVRGWHTQWGGLAFVSQVSLPLQLPQLIM
jgi:hypothetical protein